MPRKDRVREVIRLRSKGEMSMQNSAADERMALKLAAKQFVPCNGSGTFGCSFV
jgi:hypothetical protein